MSQEPHYSPRFRPELGLPWFSAAMQGLSPAQIQQKVKGCRPFTFDTPHMAPAFPVGTQVVLRPVECKCKLVVGKVYVVLDKQGRFIACGRLASMRESEELRQWGVELALCWANGAQALAPWVWPRPDRVLYALAYYGSVDVAAL